MDDGSELNDDVTADADMFVADSSSDAPSGALFDGDTGTLSHHQRLAVAAVKKFPYVSPLSERGAQYWPLVREHQAVVRSRLNDEFLDLFFSDELEVAYQVPAPTSEDLETVNLLTQRRFNPEQTVLLVALRNEQRQQLAGGADRTQIVMNVKDLRAAVEDLRPLTTADRAKAQTRTEKALEALAKAKVILPTGDSKRVRISPVLEALMPLPMLSQLVAELAELVDEPSPADDDEDAQLAWYNEEEEVVG